MQLRGEWSAALEEAQLARRALRAAVRTTRPPARPPIGRRRFFASRATWPRPSRHTARPAAAATSRSRAWRCCCSRRGAPTGRCRDRPGRGGHAGGGRAGEAPAGLRRDHAGRRRSRAGAPRLRRARGDGRELRQRDAARARRARPGGGCAGRRRCPRRPGRAAPGVEAVAGAGSAVRRRACPLARGAGLPGAGRRRDGRAGDGSGPRRLRAARGRAGRRPGRRDVREPRRRRMPEV